MSTDCHQFVTFCFHFVTTAHVGAAHVKFSLPMQLRIGSCEWPPAAAPVKFSQQLRSCKQLANCTKNLYFSCKNFVILPYVKTLDKIKNLCYNIYRK